MTLENLTGQILFTPLERIIGKPMKFLNFQKFPKTFNLQNSANDVTDIESENNSVVSDEISIDNQEVTRETTQNAPAERLITREEVSDHVTDASLWIIIKNRVYDLTEFVEMHPGGKEIIQEHCGYDATQAFQDVGHSEDVHKMMKQYCIGILDE